MVLGCQLYFLFIIIILSYFLSYAEIIFQLKKVIRILRFIYGQGCNMAIIREMCLSKSLFKKPLYLELITKAIIQNLNRSEFLFHFTLLKCYHQEEKSSA